MALVKDYTVERGIAFSTLLAITTSAAAAVDLTGVTVEAHVRLARPSTGIRYELLGEGPVITTFDVELLEPPTLGKVRLTLPIEKTLLLDGGSIYDYDAVLTFDDDRKQRIIKGQLTVEELTTHA